MPLRALVIFALFLRFSTAQDQTVPQPPAADAPAAPPEVDTALRARVNHFYQAHVDGKFRVADQVVAEDSKDAYFAMPKQRYERFSIVRINYKENFQKAEAVVACLGEWAARGQRMKVNMVLTSLWKQENGQWFWYMLPPGEVQSPFGTLFKGMDPNKKDEGPQSKIISVPRDPQAAAAAILGAVKTDKTELMLSSFEKSSGTVKILNGLGGTVHVRVEVDGKFSGLTFGLDKAELKGGEEAILTFTCDPQDRAPKPTLTARIFVEETNQSVPVKLLFAVPPEIEKQIPKELRRTNP